MGETSIGGVIAGVVLALLGIAAVVGGGIAVAESTFAEGERSESDHGPLLGGSEEESGSMDLTPVVGLVLVVGGIAASISGFAMTRRSFERGKDRAIGEEEG